MTTPRHLRDMVDVRVEGDSMKGLRFATALAAAPLAVPAALAGQGSGTISTSQAAAAPTAPAEESAVQRWERLRREAAERDEAARRARETYENDMREAAAARARYEEGLRAHQAEMARLEAERQAYERRRAEYEREIAAGGGRGRNSRRAAPTAAAATDTPAVASAQCEAQQRRGRRRGRAAGAVLGAGAGLLGRRLGAPAGLIVAALPVGALLGDTIARLLDRCEQEQAAAATEEAMRGGVGTTASWTSETRPEVSGASMVTAQETSADGECLTVTDIVIVDGEETRAPKRMCRRPPSTRYVRV